MKTHPEHRYKPTAAHEEAQLVLVRRDDSDFEPVAQFKTWARATQCSENFN